MESPIFTTPVTLLTFSSPLTPNFGPHYFIKVALIETADGAKVEEECSVIISLKLSEVFQNFDPAPLVYLASRTPASSFSSHVTMLSLFCLLLPVFLLFFRSVINVSGLQRGPGPFPPRCSQSLGDLTWSQGFQSHLHADTIKTCASSPALSPEVLTHSVTCLPHEIPNKYLKHEFSKIECLALLPQTFFTYNVPCLNRGSSVLSAAQAESPVVLISSSHILHRIHPCKSHWLCRLPHFFPC